LGGGSGGNHGRPVQVELPPDTHVAAVGGGYFFSIALTSNGRVLAWGGNTSGVDIIPPTLVNLPPGTRVAAIAAGYGSSLALAVRTATLSTSAPPPGGPVFASGLDNFGQLGEGGAPGSSVPVPSDLPPGTEIAAVAAADEQSLALTSAGQLLTWGSGDHLSRTAGPTPVPVSLPAGTRVTAVAASADHALALTADGRIFDYGQAGCGDDVCATNQVTLPAGAQVTAIAAGDAFSLALTSDGRVLAWGSNAFGLQGDDNTSQQFGPEWVDLPAGAGVIAIAAGGEHWLALTSDGRVLAWGDNESGDLGNGTTVSTGNEFGAPTPAQVALPAGTQVTAIAAGTEDSQAVTSDGRVLAWGYNAWGQLGDGSTGDSSVPVPMGLPAGTRATAVAAGQDHSLALTAQPTASLPKP
jgi:alpha-tubulin suppressor-like RCC1 family protein